MAERGGVAILVTEESKPPRSESLVAWASRFAAHRMPVPPLVVNSSWSYRASTVALKRAAAATSNSCLLFWDLFLFSLENTVLTDRLRRTGQSIDG